MTHHPERDLCRAVLRSCVVDISHGAGLDRPRKLPRGMPPIVAADNTARQRTNRAVDAFLVSVAWLNGHEAPLTIALVCDALDLHPSRVRMSLAHALGIVTEAPDHLLTGPFTLEHGRLAAELIRRVDAADAVRIERAAVDDSGDS